MVLDGLGGEEQALGDVAVAQAVGDQGEDLELARGELRRVLARRRPRAARQVGRAAPAQLARDHGGGRHRAQALELVVRAPLRRLVARAGERERCLVRAAERGPALGGLLEGAGELERVRLGDVGVRIGAGAGTSPPHGDLAGHPAGAGALREGGDALGLGEHAVVVAAQPRRLGARHGDRLDALQLGTGERERLVERSPGVGVAATGAQPSGHGEREHDRERRGATAADHERGGGAGVVPASLVSSERAR